MYTASARGTDCDFVQPPARSPSYSSLRDQEDGCEGTALGNSMNTSSCRSVSLSPNRTDSSNLYLAVAKLRVRVASAASAVSAAPLSTRGTTALTHCPPPLRPS